MKKQGAEIVLVDAQKGFFHVMETAFRLSEEDPNLYFLYQHHDTFNKGFHKITTGMEILTEIESYIDTFSSPLVWIAAIGTGGTFIGVKEALQTKFDDIRSICVTPSEMPWNIYAT